MSEVLSQREIDRLVSGISAGDIQRDDLAEMMEQKEVYEFDFRQPMRVSQDQLKTIRTIHESFCDLMGFFLTSHLQTVATVELLAVDQLHFSDYALSIANPCVVYTFDIKETEGRAFIELTPDLAFMVVERLLGGTSGRPASPRVITAIEQKIIQPLVRQALGELTAAWKPIYSLNFELANFESNSDFLQIASGSEIVIVISFEVKVAEEAFLMNLCYPSFALEEVIAQLMVEFGSHDLSTKNKQESFNKIREHLKKTALQLRCILGTTEIRIQELLELSEGDVLTLDTAVDEEMPLRVEERTKFMVRPGIMDGRLAVKISREVTDEN